MRFSSKIFAIALAAAILAFVVWALCLQHRWAQSNQPLKLPAARGGEEEPKAEAHPATSIIGKVDDDTHKAIQKGLKDEKKKP